MDHPASDCSNTADCQALLRLLLQIITDSPTSVPVPVQHECDRDQTKDKDVCCFATSSAHGMVHQTLVRVKSQLTRDKVCRGAYKLSDTLDHAEYKGEDALK